MSAATRKVGYGPDCVPTALSRSSETETNELHAQLLKSESETAIPEDTPKIEGYDFNSFFGRGADYDALFRTYATMGFQATNLAMAIDEVNRMLRWRLSDEPNLSRDDLIEIDEKGNEVPIDPSKVKCTIFLGYTSNMISCGVREVIRFLVQHKLVDCIVTTAGGIEEDFIKCFHPFYLGDFKARGAVLRKSGINRIGNVYVPNKNYCAFEAWLTPILDEMLKEQQEQKKIWTPSTMIARLGERINNPNSVYYWAWKNNIPVFCPALTDGSLGDIIFFHSINNPGLIIDIAGDIRAVNDIALRAKRSGIVILGGGVVKHHICNANLMRNGADHAVFINTGQEFDGSDSGANPEEAISWGKIKMTAKPVKVCGDASLIFPLLVSQTFAKYVLERDGKLPSPSSEDAPVKPTSTEKQKDSSSAAASSSSN